LDIDSQRPDHLGCYGYHRNTSPAIDALAAEGLRCTGVYASDAPCLPSRTAFYSGRFGIQTGVVGHGGTAAEPKREGAGRGFQDRFGQEGLAALLQDAGYHTAMISPFGQRHSAWWFYAGFKEIHNTGLNGIESAEHVMPSVERWLSSNAASDNWYLHVNLWDPHTPYRVPEDYGNPFAEEPIEDWYTEEVLKRHMRKTGPHSALDPGMYGDADPTKYPRMVDRIDSPEKLRRWIDGYDTAVRYVDDQVARMVSLLREAGVYDETAIVISADHGENQGELGIYGEHGTADQGTCNIPMIIRWPGGARGAVDEGLHYNLDFAPTLLDLLELGPAPEIFDGRSYAETVRNGRPSGRDEVVISQCAHVCQRSVRFQNWLYMRTYHDGFHLFPDEMLFDLETDPHEQNDLANEHPDICVRANRRLEAWHAEQMWKMSRYASDVVDPLWKVIEDGGPFHARHRPEDSQLPAYLERLRATGRQDGARALEEKYAAYLQARP
jgi:arylsulfatase A-like enzyme